MRSRFFPVTHMIELSHSNIYKLVTNSAMTALEKLGPYQNEKCYENFMCDYLFERDIPYQKQKETMFISDDNMTRTGPCDILIARRAVVELKVAVSGIIPQHVHQALRYGKSLQTQYKSQLDGTMLVLVVNFMTPPNKPAVVQIWNNRTNKIVTKCL